MLEIVDRVEYIFKRTCHVLFDILGARTLIGSHDHQGIGVDIGIQVDRKSLERK